MVALFLRVALVISGTVAIDRTLDPGEVAIPAYNDYQRQENNYKGEYVMFCNKYSGNLDDTSLFYKDYCTPVGLIARPPPFPSP